MTATLFLISLVFTPAPSVGDADWLLTPRLDFAQELFYRGTFTEEFSSQGALCTRSYRLETRVFVLDSSARGYEVALFTSLKQHARRPVPEDEHPDGNEPCSVRLETARVTSEGRIHSENGASLLVPLTGPATVESEALIEVPRHRVGQHQSWGSAEEGRPPRTWTVLGVDEVNGSRCVQIEGIQQTEDWDRPRADRTAWRRRDLVWLSSRLGIACRVERTILLRAPARQEPTQRSVARYELESSLIYPRQLYEDRLREISVSRKLSEAAEPLLREPGRHGSRAWEALLAKIDLHLENQPPTPYREAVMQVKRRIDAARHGQAPTVHVPEHAPLSTVADLGQLAPDFMAPVLTCQGSVQESVRLHHLLGRPILLIFYNPASATADPMLRFARTLQDGNTQGITVIGLALSENVESVRKQHADLRLSFPVVAGKGLRRTYAVDATPKLFVLDATGIIRASYIGWGPEIPGAVHEEFLRAQEVSPAPK